MVENRGLSIFVATVVILTSSSLVSSDLPIHATIKDVKGVWTVYLGAEHPTPQLCGSSLPNRNHENLVPELENFKSWIEKNQGGIKHVTTMELSDERTAPLPLSLLGTFQDQSLSGSQKSSHRNSWNALAVHQSTPRKESSLQTSTSGSEIVGSWTMIYDEGLEIRYGDNIILTAFLKYSLSPKEHCHLHEPRDSDQEDSNGRTACYITNPGKTSLGWYVNYSGEKPTYGCWYGEKDSTENVSPTPFLYVSVNPTRENSSNSENLPKSTHLLWTETRYAKSSGVPTHFIRQQGWSNLATYNRSRIPSEFTGSSFLEVTSDSGTQSYACDPKVKPTALGDLNKPSEELPANFSSVANPFSSPNTQWTTPVMQGNCGACFAIASAYVLQERATLMLKQLHEMGGNSSIASYEIPERSFQSILSCSFLNQGCNGGYPFLVGKWTQLFGLPPAECQEYQITDKTRCPLDLNSLALLIENSDDDDKCGSKESLYASGYGYVGGCYECCSESAMMEEIYYRGPIVAALDAPSNLFQYRDGIFDDADYHHSRFCDDPDHDLNGWEFTNHAVVLVGWGEENRDIQGENKSVKYWIVRNSWGPSWGQHGYFKVLRGHNLGGIEAQAVFIDPDISRGYLAKEAKNIHKAALQDDSSYNLGLRTIAPHGYFQ